MPESPDTPDRRGDRRFPRCRRLRKGAEFERVFQGQAYAADDWLVVNACPNGLDRSRLGLSVSRKVGNAVVRNRWKRLIREAFRLTYSELPLGLDLVVRPRRGATPELSGIRRSLPSLARRIARRLARSPGDAGR